MVQISRVSSYQEFELSRLNLYRKSTSKPIGMDIWFKLLRVRVIQGLSQRGYTVVL